MAEPAATQAHILAAVIEAPALVSAAALCALQALRWLALLTALAALAGWLEVATGASDRRRTGLKRLRAYIPGGT